MQTRPILAAVREWVSLLIAERYQQAYDFLYHPAGEYWTPELIRTMINNYGQPEPLQDGTVFKVTSLATTVGVKQPDHEVNRYGDNWGQVWFDLPLNGAWSDVTATLDFKVIDDQLVLMLNDIHVM